MAESRSPSQAEVINRAVARGQRELWVSLPVAVLAYHLADQTVDVQPQLADAYEDANGVLQVEVLHPINAVPVNFPAGGNLRITFPIQPGDTGMVTVCDRSIDGWALNGGQQQPLDQRRHHLADAWFTPGVRPKGAWKNADGQVITIGDDGKSGSFAARVADPVEGAAAFLTWVGQVQTALNGLAPGAVAPLFPVTAGTQVGDIKSGSSTVRILG